MCWRLEYSRRKFFARFLVLYVLATNIASGQTMSCISCINIQRMRWLDHFMKMNEEALAKKIFHAIIDSKRRSRRRLILLCEAGKDLQF